MVPPRVGEVYGSSSDGKEYTVKKVEAGFALLESMSDGKQLMLEVESVSRSKNFSKVEKSDLWR